MNLQLTEKEERLIKLRNGENRKALGRYFCFHPFRKIVLEDAVM